MLPDGSFMASGNGYVQNFGTSWAGSNPNPGCCFGNMDAMIFKMDKNGDHICANQWGGSGSDGAGSIVGNVAGNAVVFTTSSGEIDPLSSLRAQPYGKMLPLMSRSYSDPYLVKVDANCEVLPYCEDDSCPYPSYSG